MAWHIASWKSFCPREPNPKNRNRKHMIKLYVTMNRDFFCFWFWYVYILIVNSKLYLQYHAAAKGFWFSLNSWLMYIQSTYLNIFCEKKTHKKSFYILLQNNKKNRFSFFFLHFPIVWHFIYHTQPWKAFFFSFQLYFVYMYCIVYGNV